MANAAPYDPSRRDIQIVSLNGQSRILSVQLHWNGIFLKQICRILLRIPSDDNFEILLSGEILPEHKHLSDLQLSNQSVLQLIFRSPSLSSLVGCGEPPGSASTYRSRFHVYCACCEGLRRAKLRVVCNGCGETCFLLTREPHSISDSAQHTGQCFNPLQSCPGQRAKLSLTCLHDVHHDVAALWLITDNFDMQECVICSTSSSPLVRFPCTESNHVVCLPCFVTYAQISLRDGRFVFQPTEAGGQFYTLSCPMLHRDTQTGLLPEPHYFKLCGAEFYNIYKDMAAQHCAQRMGVVYCPQVTCSTAWIPDSQDRSLCCPNVHCSYVFCRICREADHHPEPCGSAAGGAASEVEAAGQEANNQLDSTMSSHRHLRMDLPSRQVIVQSTKACPNCFSATEKNGGCMHMTCAWCQCDWCWLCQRPWSSTCQEEHWFN